MSAPTDPTRERSQHEDDVLERIAKIVATDNVPPGEHYSGDDAAVLKPFVGEAIISTDVAVLGVHLDANSFRWETWDIRPSPVRSRTWPRWALARAAWWSP